MGLDNYSTPAKTTAESWRELHPLAKMLLVFLGLITLAIAVGCAGGAVKWALWVLTVWTPGK